ncbi:hypothetical protein ACXYMU_13190 [Pontibacter sp. CAU 1760]
MHLSLLLPLLLSYLLAFSPTWHLPQDLQQDYTRLTQNGGYFISDNSTPTPSVQTVASDLALFQLVANLDLSGAKTQHYTSGNHTVTVWQLPEGDIRKVYQVESQLHLDTVVTQRYLDNRRPTQQRLVNDFTFRSYTVATADDATKLHYLTEATQGLLGYKLGEKEVVINYSPAKEGLADVLPVYEKEVAQALLKAQQL